MPAGTPRIVDTRARLLRCQDARAAALTMMWDGRDERGHTMPAGSYWFLARVDGRPAGRRIMRVR